MNYLSVNNLLGIKSLSQNDIELIFQLADNFCEVLDRPIKKIPTLRDITVANLFFEPSTRTRVSFELAEKRLSADIVNFSASSSSLSKGETLIDTANNILAMKVDMIVLRHPFPGAAEFLSRHVPSVIVNAGDGSHEHPTQALLDAYSIKKKIGQIKGVKVLIVGDIKHSRVALSNIFCLKKLGAEVRVCGPSTLIPKFLKDLGVEVSYDIHESIKWCDVANILRIQLERQKLKFFPSNREYAMLFGINHKMINDLNHDILLMHPGPINRGVEVSSQVIDSNQSIVLNQVHNGLAIRMAVLYLLAAKLKQK
tara:strand:- start:204 stop:1136 length:933 start_codon:yes stop_codon:yes gene_type:complete